MEDTYLSALEPQSYWSIGIFSPYFILGKLHQLWQEVTN